MNKKLFLGVLIFSLIGFATGINYCKMIKGNVMICLEECMEFGLYGIVMKKSIRKIIFEIICSGIKWLLLIISGAVSWVTFPITVISLFFVSFRTGMNFENIFLLYKTSDFLSIILMSVLTFVIIVFFSFSAYNCICFKAEHNKYNRFNYSDLSVVRNLFFEFIIFLILCFLIDFLIIILKCSINGMYFSFI